MYVNWQSEGVKRVYTGLVLILALAAAISLRLLTVWIFDAIVLIIAVAAVWEIAKAKNVESRGVSIFYLLSYIVAAYTMFVIGITTGFAFWLHLVMQFVVILIFALYTMLMNYMDKDFAKECTLKKAPLGKASAMTAWEFVKVVIYPFLLVASLLPINHLGSFVTQVPDGAFDPVGVRDMATLGILMVFFVSCFTDTFQYIVGKTLKGPKLCPKISPNKTISGAVGGLFGGMVGALFPLMILSRNGTLLQAFLTDRIGETVIVQVVFIFIGLFGAAVTIAGDLYASWLKRRAGI